MTKTNSFRNPHSIALLLILIGNGCSTTVVRENIISNIGSGFGATITENPQTQLYELKLGYIRSQFYSVPTGKTILKEKANSTTSYSGETVNAADITPELVSGIRLGSGTGKNSGISLGLNVSESFAVGKEAVNSPAAIAMYIASAENPETARAASDAVVGAEKALTLLKPGSGDAAVNTVKGLLSFLDGLPRGEYPNASRVADGVKDVTGLPVERDFPLYRYENVIVTNTTSNGTESITNLLVFIDADPAGDPKSKNAFESFLKYRRDLLLNIERLEHIENNVRIARVSTAAQPGHRLFDGGERIELGKQVGQQTSKLSAIEKDFTSHSAIGDALKYVAKITR